MPDAAPLVDQVEYWNGLVGQRWAEHQERLDRAFAPLTQGLLEGVAARPGEQVIDVGCGAGVMSLALAPVLGREGRILAVDISRPMLERARAREREHRSAEWAPIAWREADAGTFAFPSGGSDLIVSRFGTMFFADPVAAFRNLRQALRPGGRLVMLCWQPLAENPWIAVPRAAMLPIVPVPPPVPPDAPGPFAFADAARVGAILARVGFDEVRSSTVAGSLQVCPAPQPGGAAVLDAAVAFVTELGPASALLREVDPITRTRAMAAVRGAFQAKWGSAPPQLEARCWLFTAANPG
ncbi:MAG TPA: class I SAM-dependent methyltransferase [Acetobacteraceae bacterium]|nr:class I SAM-dependent methyltransferase [Acetobacteraceae bacterium]